MSTFQTLNEEELQSMQSLNNALISLLVLALPDSIAHLTLDTDICDVQVVCVLLQERPDKMVKPNGYWSRSLRNAGRR